MVIIIALLAFALALGGQTRSPDNPQNVRTGQATRPVGAGLCWDAFGLVTTVGCTGGSGGSTETASNVGTGVGIFASKVSLDLRFKSLLAGSNRISITGGTNEVTIDAIAANFLLSGFGGSLNLSQLAQGGATTGQLLQWNGTNWVPASTGGGGGPANTDALAEGSTNLYYTQARARAALSVTGILSYDNGTGVMSCPNCANITSTYSNPAWISALAWSKITGAPTFQLLSEKGTANGYAGLGAGGLVPVAQLGSGTANSTNFLRGDGTWTNPAGSVNLLLAGTSIGTRPGLNFISGSGVTIAAVDDSGNNRVNITAIADTSVMLSRLAFQAGSDLTCIPTSASATVLTCVPAGNALTAYTNGMRLMLRPDVTLSGSPTLNVSTLGAKRIYAADGTTAATGTAGLSYWIVYNENLTTTTVNTSGTAVTGTAGAAFTSNMVGTQIKIGSTFYTVAAFTSGTSITLGATAGTQTGVTLAAGGWVMPATGGTSITSSVRGAYASLPTCDSSIAGQTYYLTNRGVDGKSAQCNGTSWQWYFAGKPIVEPPAVASWTGVNTPNCSDSAGIVVCAPAATGAVTYKSILRSIPVAPYNIEVDFGSYSDANSAGCGIALTNGTTTASAIKRMIINGGASGTQNVLDIQFWSNYTTFGNQLYGGVSGSAGPNGTVKMRITDDNTNRIWRVQTGGGVWLTIASESRTADLTPTHYGMVCQLATTGLYQFSLVNVDVY